MDQRNKKRQSMDVLGEDELWLILNRVCHPNDRKSVSLVCKQWRKLEALTRSSITICLNLSLCTTNILSVLLHRLLPRYPNLVTFEITSMSMKNNDLKFVAQTCPNLETLTLYIHPCEKGIEEGMRALATYCPKLSRVKLRGGSRYVEVEVLSFLTSAHINLTHLDLSDCRNPWVTDRTLEAIASSNCFKTIKALILGRRHKISDSGFSHLQNMGALEELDLKRSRYITNRALEFLAHGSVSKTMKKLVLAGCKKITDSGVSFLQNMCTLEELNLEGCLKVTQRGLEFLPKTMKIFSCTFQITEVGVSLLRDFYVLEKLKLRGCSPNNDGLECLVNASCLKTFTCNFKVNDAGLSVLGKKCLLEELELQNGGLITDCGLRSLANGLCSKTMKKLTIKGCHGITNCGMWYLREMRVLEELNIGGCTKVTDCELDFLSKTMKKLTCGFEITDLGLYNLGKICLLEELVLEESSLITDFGLECLTSASCSKTMKKLDISNCHKITDSGMKLLQKMRVLEYVTMTGRWRNNVTEQSIRAIKAIPTLRRPPALYETIS